MLTVTEETTNTDGAQSVDKSKVMTAVIWCLVGFILGIAVAFGLVVSGLAQVSSEQATKASPQSAVEFVTDTVVS